MRPGTLICVSILLAGAACDTVHGTALFEVPRGQIPTTEFYALPFPNDIRRDDAGHPMLADYPRPASLVALYVEVREEMLVAVAKEAKSLEMVEVSAGGRFGLWICGVGPLAGRLRDTLRAAGYERRAVRAEQW